MSIFRNSDTEELKRFVLLLFVDSILLSTSNVEKSFIKPKSLFSLNPENNKNMWHNYLTLIML